MDESNPTQRPTTISDELRPIVVVGAHGQSLFLHVAAVPREGETVLGHGYQETVDGGKATNQAIAAARLGAPVRFVSVVGADDRGRRVLAILDKRGVDRRWVLTVDAPTDIGFVMLPPSGIPAIASANDLARQLDEGFVQGARAALGGASVVVCQLEAPEACALAALRLARAAGAITVLNPAPAIDVSPGLLALADIIVPNEHEVAAILGREAPLAELAAALADSTAPSQVVVTAGSDGAYLASAGAPVRHVPALPVTPVDTTGAGDAFVGALAVRLRAGDSIEEAARFAVAAASISVTRPGTMEAFASLAEVAGAASAADRGGPSDRRPDLLARLHDA